MTWTIDEGLDVTSAFRGITTPISELTEDIESRGWTVSKIDFKNGTFIALGKNQHGETIERTGPTDKTALGNLLTAVMRREYMRTSAQRMVGMWTHHWTDQLVPIAKAYAAASVYDPKAAPAWQELARDSQHRLDTLGKHIEIDWTHDPAPYESAHDMREDIHDNRKLTVTMANAEHPVWSTDQNLAFRAVHDIVGHGVGAGEFGWHGENMACAAHMPLLSPEAQKALFTECIGQTAFNHHYRTLGPQKVALLDEHIDHVQEDQNSPDHQPVHPSQTIPPSKPVSVTASVGKGELHDPNKGWTPGIDPLPNNAYLWHGDPLDLQGATESAHSLSSDWKGMDLESQRSAVMNAFRATLMAPRRDLHWNAKHYQDLATVPANVTDPKRYYDALDTKRQAHNTSLGLNYDKAYAPLLMDFFGTVKAHNKHLRDDDVHEKAHRELFHMRSEEEERVLSEDKNNKLSTADVEAKVDVALAKRLKMLTKPKADPKVDFHGDQIFHQATAAPDHYQPFLANHLKTISQLAHHTDRLHQAAMEDPGEGHDFRAVTTSLGVPGVGSKEASFAWFLLNPHSSQLATITPHHLEALGHKPEEMGERDYFKFERELAAGKDAAGYNHVPLGLFSKTLYDHKRSPGKHQDYSGLHPVTPSPPESIEHHPAFDDWTEPDWWKDTKPARDQTAQDWDQIIAINHPSDRIPFKPKVAATGAIPHFVHEGETHVGEPDQPLMHHIKNTLGLSTEEIWGMNHDAWKQ